MQRKKKCAVCLCCVMYLPQPLDISALSSQVLDLYLDLQHHLTPIPFSDFWIQTETYKICFPGSQTFGLGLNFATGFPCFIACRQQSVDFSVSIIVWGNSYKKISLSRYMYVISYWFSFFGEPWLIHIVYRGHFIGLTFTARSKDFLIFSSHVLKQFWFHV